MRTKFETKKSISFALGFLIIFLFTGNAFGWEIRIITDPWDFICPVQDANGLIASDETLVRGEIPGQINCNACRGMSDGTKVFSDVSRGFLMCETDLLCGCPSGPGLGEKQ